MYWLAGLFSKYFLILFAVPDCFYIFLSQVLSLVSKSCEESVRNANAEKTSSISYAAVVPAHPGLPDSI